MGTAGCLVTPSSTGVTTERSTNTADTTMLGGLRHGGCKWISGVAVDNSLFLSRHSMQLAIHPHRRSSRKRSGRNHVVRSRSGVVVSVGWQRLAVSHALARP